MNITFDRLKLALPHSSVQILKPDEFSINYSKNGVESSMKYEQKQPFYYQIFVNFNKNIVCVEFSGKALLEEYPNLINASNISSCFTNINNCGVCFIDPETAVSQSMVEQCDVTTDIPYEGNMKEIKNSLIIKNNKEYTISTSAVNRFSIENTAVTKRKRERLIVYDKGDEMARSSNRPFLGHINNPNEQIEYFKDKMRLELNLNSLDRIRKYLNIQDPQLHSILNSTADPIGAFLHNALSPDSTLALIKHKTPKLRNLEHLLLMCLCDFDMATIERVIRDTTGKNNSITNSLAPYKLLYEQVERNAPSGHNETYFIKLRDLLRESVTIAFSSSDCSSRNDLHYLYFSDKHDSDETYTIENQDHTSILNISMPQLPGLPES